MNTIIIAIIVLVVLVIVIAFFAGGSSSVVDKIRSIFTGSTAGEDINIAVQNCQQYCDQYKNLRDNGASDATLKQSAYCSKWFKIDFDQQNGADKWTKDESTDEKVIGEYKHYYCGSDSKHVNDPLAPQKDLGVACPQVQTC